MFSNPATDQTGSSTDQSTDELTGSVSDWWWLLAVGLTAVTLCLPFSRYVWFLGDEGVLLHAAERMLGGDRIYVDFFEFLPPGGFIITEAWFGMAGISLISARMLAILTIAGIACLTYLACRQSSKCALLSALIAVAWVIISQGSWTQVNHHWFTTLFSMVAAWTTLYSIGHPHLRLRWLVAAGIAVGGATMVTPTRGALAVLAVATPFVNYRRYRRELAAIFCGAAVIPICVLGYLLLHGELTAAFNDTIIFTASRYASIQATPFGLWGNRQLKLLFPLAALITLLACARDRGACFQDPVFRACATFGLAGFFGCFPRPDGAHIGFAAPLVCPLLAHSVRRLIRDWLPSYRYAAAAIAIAVGFPAARSLLELSYTVLRAKIVATPRGDVVPGERGVRELAMRLAATPSQDGFFFYPYMPMAPFLTARRHVSRYDIFTPNYTLPSQYQEACVSAMRDASWVVIDRDWTDSKFLKSVFPAMRDPEPPETRKFEQAMETGFEFVAREGPYELRRRLRWVDEHVCDDIAR